MTPSGTATAGVRKKAHAFEAPHLFNRLAATDRRATVFAATLGVAIVFLVCLPLAAALNIWIDEAFTLHTTGAGLGYAFAQTVAFEAQPPLYFLLEAAWRTLDEASPAFGRCLSILFAAAAVAVIVGAARRIAPSVPPAAVAVVTALNPIVIWAAVEMRVYALVLLIGAVLTWTFFEGFLVDRRSRRAQICYGAFAIIGLYAQYYIGFILVAHAIALLTVRRSAIRPFTVAMTLVAVSFGPFLRIALAHVAASGQFVLHGTVVQAAHEIANAVFVFVLPHDINWIGSAKLAGFVLAAVLSATLVCVGRPTVDDKAARGVGLQWLFSLVIFTVLFRVSGIPIDSLRHLVIVAPSSLLIALLLVSSLTRRRALLGGVAAATYVVFALTSLWGSYRPPLMKLGDWQRVAAVLATDRQTAPIAVFPAEAALPLSEYLPLKTVSIPAPMPFTIDYVRAMTLTGESQVGRVLDPLHVDGSGLWVVTTGACGVAVNAAYNYNCRYLEAYLQRRYQLRRSIAFRGALVRLYSVPKSPSRVRS